jgi:vitamin B12 transporter
VVSAKDWYRGVWRCAGILAIASACWAWRATQGVAQGAAPEPSESELAPSIRPPELIEGAEARYPEQARAERREAAVLLRVTVSADGNVAQVEVVEPAGYGFDEAARDAALRFRFEPARRDGQPIAARILFRVEIKPPVEAPAPAEPAAPLPVAPAPSTRAADRPIEVVTVAGARSEAERLQQSAEAVTVVDTRKAQERTADLGEVLARTQGVSVRRAGGLGSSTRFSLNGLYDDQIRFFLDGVPLKLAGYPFGIENVPVNLVERVEIYRGVVPIRFGADALGGAVNLVSDQRYETHAGASYQVGSFSTRRITVDGRHRDEPTNIVAGGTAFFDITENDYEIEVEVSNARGKMRPAVVPRFHDDYRAYGATLEAGVVERPWAKRLLLRGFASVSDKQLQHNLIMTVPYGEITYGETVYGLTGRYDVALDSQVDLEIALGYAHRIMEYVDKSEWTYTWYGERLRQNRFGSERSARPRDQTEWEDGTFGRGLVSWELAPEHVVRASLTAAFTTRTGDEHIQLNPDGRDPLTAQRELFTFVSGLEYELNLWDERMSNIVFAKDYYYDARTEEPLAGGVWRSQDALRHRQGVGDALRFRFTPWLYAKLSYEYATRLPRPDEVFGNGVLIDANLELEPEVSHNANFGPRVELKRTPLGSFMFDVNAFLRDSEQLILLLGGRADIFTYQNVYSARAIGLENALGWESPGRYVSLEGALTWQDIRNTSSEGTFGRYEGDRIPNLPYLFGSWGASVRLTGMPEPQDSLEPFYSGRYVHDFFRTWESLGTDSPHKDKINAQARHSVGVSWIVSRSFARITTTLELDNVSDAKVFDNYGAQRPGRAFYLKLTGEL